jgi:hypothetical protein
VQRRVVLQPVAILLLAASFTGCDPNSVDKRPCVDVSSHVLDFIAHGVSVRDGATLSNGKAVPSADYEEAYFVAAKLEGPRVDTGQVGLWVTNDLNDVRWLYSVNDAANRYTNWGDARYGNPRFSTSDDGAKEALACASG